MNTDKCEIRLRGGQWTKGMGINLYLFEYISACKRQQSSIADNWSGLYFKRLPCCVQF